MENQPVEDLTTKPPIHPVGTSLSHNPVLWGYITLSLLVLIFLVSTILLYLQNTELTRQITTPQSSTPTKQISSYEQCLKAEGSVIQESFPPTCVTKEGVHFSEELTYEEKQNLIPPQNETSNYKCPANGWVDCMPILDEAKQKACSTDAMNWYKENCPDFQGGAM